MTGEHRGRRPRNPHLSLFSAPSGDPERWGCSFCRAEGVLDTLLLDECPFEYDEPTTSLPHPPPN